MYAVIGDVHGCYKTLVALTKKLPKDHKLVFVGDLIDKGPSDNEVVDFVKNNNHICVIGNHEHMAVDAFNNSGVYGHKVWESNGGKGLSYFGEDRLRWMSTLPLYWQTSIKDSDSKTLLVSHAGVYNSLDYCSEKIHFTSSYDQIWGLDYFILWHRLKVVEIDNVFQIFGHTPVKNVCASSHSAYIDTGCVYGFTKKLTDRTLSAMLWPSKEVIQQPYCE